MTHELPTIVTEALGGSPLAQLGIAGARPEWFGVRPQASEQWKGRVAGVQREFSRDWLRPLRGALAAAGAARARLERTLAAGGVVVTTGQQPGLFGGPMYTLSKALSALALADALERLTGVACAPVFWAATDDADYREASQAWLRNQAGAIRVSHNRLPTEGIPMTQVPVGDLTSARAALFESVGAAADPGLVRAVAAAYSEGATIGSAYATLMRHVLEPLGISVLDASHADYVSAAQPILRKALSSSVPIAGALAARESDLRAAGFEPQVAHVEGLSLVFRAVEGRKTRVLIADAAMIPATEALSANVLLRPVVERALLPTVAYVAGPGELSYFAQVTAVARAGEWSVPLGVPRWSCTVVEPRVQHVLARRGISREALGRQHEPERRVALDAMDPSVLAALSAWRADVVAAAGRVKDRIKGSGEDGYDLVVEGTVRSMSFRLDRLERRLVAGAKRRAESAMREIAMARGSLYPGGVRQERALSFIMLLASYGPGLLEAMRVEADRHAQHLVMGSGTGA